MAFLGNWSASEITGDHEGIIEFRDVNGAGWDVSFQHSVERRQTRVDGDLNYDNVLDVDDVNVVSRNIALGSTNARLDLNDDDKVDHSDFHYLVTGLMNTWIGDSNLDGEFNSGDFVDVFTAGKYETGDFANWSEGDWNADGRFDSTDFVAAFSDGGYEQGPRMAVASVPEPSGLLAPLLGMLLIVRRLRGS